MPPAERSALWLMLSQDDAQQAGIPLMQELKEGRDELRKVKALLHALLCDTGTDTFVGSYAL